MAAASREQRVLIAHLQNAPEAAQCTLSSVMLPEPKSQGGTAQMCCLLGEQGQPLLEVQHFKTMYSSWLLQQQLLADGGVYLASPLDPLFVLLPLLDKARQKKGNADADAGVFCAFDDLCDAVCGAGCSSSGEDMAQQLQQLMAAAQPALLCICDCKEVDGDKYYRLSTQRALAWLRLKVGRCKTALAAQLAGLDQGAQDAYVLSFLSEYLTPTWSSRLATHLQVDLTALDTTTGTTQARSKPAPGGGPPDKKAKLDPKEVARLAARKRAEEERKAKLAKEAAGMKTISSFFARKAVGQPAPAPAP